MTESKNAETVLKEHLKAAEVKVDEKDDGIAAIPAEGKKKKKKNRK